MVHKWDVTLLLHQAPRSWKTVHLKATTWVNELFLAKSLGSRRDHMTVLDTDLRRPFSWETWVTAERQREDHNPPEGMRQLWSADRQCAVAHGQTHVGIRCDVAGAPASRWVLDPTPILHYTTIEVVGMGERIGRKVAEARATPRLELRNGQSDHDVAALLGCDGLDIAIDIERGILLSQRLFLDHDVVGETLVAEIEFDVNLPSEVFAPLAR
jgi:hypothetical protein